MTPYKEPPRVVFDCMVYLQATANEKGAASKVLNLLDAGAITLFVSEQILDEVRNVLSRPFVRDKNPKITDVSQNALLIRLARKAVHIVNVPEEFKYERDPKDEKYINLALVTRAEYIVTWDGDLRDLMNESKKDGKAFCFKYPFLKILSPPAFLELFEKPN
jgi:putative PIN family toxin of toxin-antitoxin system